MKHADNELVRNDAASQRAEDIRLIDQAEK